MLYETATILVRGVLNICFRMSVEGAENVPSEGAFILAVNHKSNFDPAVAAVYCPRKLNFMAKEELFKNPFFGGLIKKLGAFPVSRGKGDLMAIKAAFTVLKNKNALLIFPQGHRMKNGARGKAQTGVAMIAHKMQVPVIPMCISGEYKFRKRVKVIFGTPIEFSEYYGIKLDTPKLHELADGVLDNILSYDTERAVTEKV